VTAARVDRDGSFEPWPDRDERVTHGNRARPTYHARVRGTDWVRPVTLEGRHVRLEPLEQRHVDALTEVGLAPELWRWTILRVESRDDMDRWVATALEGRAAGLEQPFATIDRRTGRTVGSTRFLSIEPAHRRLEIGWTWVAPAWQRSAVNSEAKLLQLEHAFDTLGALRVEFKTDALNERSRAALLGIGAVHEGIFRQHMLVFDGRRRDSAYYSVIDGEWPAVREHLRRRLAEHAG
jgi:RimJ/RimL family protein N-acetyltransferase